ncbi:MAG TPA: dihydrofolate reductase family protein [Pyrinomonadaceae bacterium]|jgi:dihydrofolate reductase|nr:dihydrofolate reductase family protein [Pyrinomonadaceae bacterium]
MRKIIFGGANSLDNYIARKDDAVDWLMWSDEAAEIMKTYWQRFDTMLMGRKTYEVSLKMHPQPKKSTKKRSDPYAGIGSYVFSRTLKPQEHEGVEIIGSNAVEFVKDLKKQKGKDICLMGGGDLARSFFEAGLIDEIGFNIHPVLLGSGIPLFHEMSRQIDLELLECRPFKNGCVFVSYRIKN